jgi:carbon storage regulator
MLVLTRQEDESIVIGDGIELMVGHVGGGTAELQIDAPSGVSVTKDGEPYNRSGEDLYRDEVVDVGKDVTVIVVDIRGDRVRLGIEAPGEIPVHRREVFEAIQRENRQPGSSSQKYIANSSQLEGVALSRDNFGIGIVRNSFGMGEAKNYGGLGC